MYSIARSLLFRLDPEEAHEYVLSVLSFLDKIIPAGKKIVEDTILSQNLFGIHFPSPVGLAAGADKNAIATRSFASMGFGFLEIGTVTYCPQNGNDRPRIWRKTPEKSIVNRLGFPSDGIFQVCANLKNKTNRIPVGLNIGPNRNDVESTERVAGSLKRSLLQSEKSADYWVINLSSPNTERLRQFGTPDELEKILKELHDEVISRPVLIKVSPDTEDSVLPEIAEVAIENNVSGIIATNTVKTEWGGLSGEEVTIRSRQVLRILSSAINKKIPIVSVGGISSPEEAYLRIRLGASLVQVYTGLIYEGPGLVSRIKTGINRMLREDGFNHISEAIGVDL